MRAHTAYTGDNYKKELSKDDLARIAREKDAKKEAKKPSKRDSKADARKSGSRRRFTAVSHTLILSSDA